MKLLSPNEAKASFVNKQANDVVQVGYMKRVLADLQNSINTEKTKFEENLANQRKVYNDEKLSLQGEIRALEGIIEAKRAERDTLMIPVDSLKNEAEELVKVLKEKEQEVNKKIEELEDSIELAQIKLDRISEREQEISDLEVKLITKKVGIDQEAEQVSSGHSRLNQLIQDFNKEVEKKSKELAEKESILAIEQKRVRERIELKEKEFVEIEKGLADKRATLDAGFEELRRKQKKLNN